MLIEKKKINSLQALRALAVTLVVFIHVVNYPRFYLNLNPHLASFFYLNTWGAIGVDLFFVISGFIMTVVVPSYFKSNGWREFLTKRINRIVPLYYLFGILATVIAIYKHQFTIGKFVKSFFFLPFIDGKTFVIPFVPVGWSLSYEIYFYILIALLLGLRKKIYPVLLVCIVILSMLGVFLNQDTLTIYKFFTSPMLIEFGLGILCGLAYKYHLTKQHLYTKVANPLFFLITAIGFVLMLSSIFFVVSDIYKQELIENNNLIALMRVLIYGVPSALFLLGLVLLESNTSLTFSPTIIKLGDASYSCYLLHGYLFQTIFKVLYKYLAFMGLDVLVLLDVALCLAASTIFYTYIEKKLTQKLSYSAKKTQ